MDIFGKKFDSLHELFVYELKGVYDAELQVVEALPVLREAASEPDLKRAFEQHLQLTQRQIARLEDVFEMLDIEPDRVHCDPMAAIIKDGNKIASASGNLQVRDTGLILAAQKVEHYEIACYGTLRAWAEEMGHLDVASILQETLTEESSTDKELSGIAEAEVNIRAPGM